MPLKVADYCTSLAKQLVTNFTYKFDKVPLVIPIVLYNGYDKWTVPFTLREITDKRYESQLPYTANIKYYFINERNVNLNKLDTKFDIYTFFTGLIRSNNPEVVGKLFIKYLASLKKEKYKYVVDTLLSITRHKFAYKKEDTSTLEEAIKMLRNEDRDWVDLIEEGEKNGMKKGIQKGICFALIETLKFKFNTVPTDIIERIQSVQDENTFKQLYHSGLYATTMDHFIQSLNQFVPAQS